MKGTILAWEFPCHLRTAYVDPREALQHACTDRIQRVHCERRPIARRCVPGKTLWTYDAAPVLRKFAREVALDVAHLWDPPPVVLRWLKTGDESIREAARSAARSAAGLAAGLAARSAAWSATQLTAWSAAPSAAWWAADSAAHSAAGSAAWSAAQSAVWSAAQSAAASATGSAAAERKQSRRLGQLLVAGRKVYGQRQLP